MCGFKGRNKFKLVMTTSASRGLKELLMSFVPKFSRNLNNCSSRQSWTTSLYCLTALCQPLSQETSWFYALSGMYKYLWTWHSGINLFFMPIQKSVHKKIVSQNWNFWGLFYNILIVFMKFFENLTVFSDFNGF